MRGGSARLDRIMAPIAARKNETSEVELDAIFDTITNRPNSRSGSRVQRRSTDKQRIIEQDILLERGEQWCKLRNMHTPELNSREIRVLRQFFAALDTDGSGEVSFSELLDPLVSSGMYRSSQDVIRLLSSLDRDGSNGINFEEFLHSVTRNNFGDRSKLQVLVQCTADPLGFDMDTLLCAERRKQLLEVVTQQTALRGLSDDERIISQLLCNESVGALEVLVKKQKKKYGGTY
jgi:hypothetical protein